MARAERRSGLDEGRCPGEGKKTKRQCGNSAGAGTDHAGVGYCRYHGGNAPGQRTQAAKRMAQYEGEQIALGMEHDIDPAAALLWAVRMSAGMVEWLRQQSDKTEYGFTDRDKDAGPDKIALLRGMWIELYGAERDRLAKTAKMAVDAGIAQRMVELEERQGRFVAEALGRTLQRLGLTPAQQAQAPMLLREELMRMPAPEMEKSPLKLVSSRR